MCNVCIAKRRLEDERNIQLFVANANCSMTLRYDISTREQRTSKMFVEISWINAKLVRSMCIWNSPRTEKKKQPKIHFQCQILLIEKKTSYKRYDIRLQHDTLNGWMDGCILGTDIMKVKVIYSRKHFPRFSGKLINFPFLSLLYINQG